MKLLKERIEVTPHELRSDCGFLDVRLQPQATEGKKNTGFQQN